jgi:hypothetical protein
LYDAAVAASRSGNDTQAKKYFRELTQVAVSDERVEVKTAKAKLQELEQASK